VIGLEDSSKVCDCELCALIADLGLPAGDVRRMFLAKKGKFIQLLAFCPDFGEINVAAYEAILSPTKRATFFDMESPMPVVIRCAASYFNVRIDDIFSHNRKKETILARHVVWYLLSWYDSWSIVRIGNFFDFDHSTVSSAVEKVKDRLASDDIFASQIEEVIQLVREVKRNAKDGLL
jgi:chromosomal replication initiation ATPase DnaA